MFIRKNRNRSGSISIQIVTKIGRQNRVLKTIGCAKTKQEESLLLLQAQNEMEQMQGYQSLFYEHDDAVIDSFVDSLSVENLKIVGADLILGKIYQPRPRVAVEGRPARFGHLSRNGAANRNRRVAATSSRPAARIGQRQPPVARQENRQRIERKQLPQTVVEYAKGFIQTARAAHSFKQLIKRSRRSLVAHNIVSAGADEV